MKKLYILISAIAIIGILWVIVPMVINDVKEPDFTVLRSEKNIQLRQYAPYIVAEVTVSGDRRAAASAGFRLIADYIFGGNKAKNTAGSEKVAQKIAMTAPVIQQPTSQKIAMTAPVIQQLNDADKWTVQFVMPKEYTMATLPTPNNAAVELKPVPAKKWAVIKFSGSWSDSNLAKKLDVLMQYVNENKLQTVGAPRTAFYNAPWTLPPLRRNEVMVEVK
ncbi:MAG: heme-binding protein [Hydrotalea sp.]|nr:heme-binding protein [Hydrotalea sp.]